MELELIKLMCYGFGATAILIFIYMTALALLFSRYLRKNNKKML